MRSAEVPMPSVGVLSSEAGCFFCFLFVCKKKYNLNGNSMGFDKLELEINGPFIVDLPIKHDDFP